MRGIAGGSSDHRLQADVVTAVRALTQAPIQRSIDAAECRLLASSPSRETVYASPLSAPLGKTLRRTIARLVKTETHRGAYIRSNPANLNAHAKGLLCGNSDAWRCMFGLAEDANCTVPGWTMAAPPDEPAMVALALYRLILLRGRPLSPLLSRPAMPRAGGEGLAVSVHVRGADACDLVSYTPLSRDLPTHAEIPVTKAGKADWMRTRRRCVHPSVHLAALRHLQRHRRVSTVLLATDSAEAAGMFRNASRKSDFVLEVNEFNRSLFLPKRTAKNNGWIEFSVPFRQGNPALTVSAIKDWQLLARGQILIGTLCSMFTSVALLLATANAGRRVPAISLDECLEPRPDSPLPSNLAPPKS